MATDATWCVFKDSVNQWCVEGGGDWQLGMKNEYEYQGSTVVTEAAHWRHNVSFQST